ncbi:uncharacterized protein Dana_GF27454 [Drosophila ananassae]|uniref:Uncharacterized protein n=1 Tax=Drosophila ananassae TaxID=7217 RepID=A0A0P9BNM9_DROAN|nr:uncharacterized protein Dana_GF27454 [Drosophila ananassae]
MARGAGTEAGAGDGVMTVNCQNFKCMSRIMNRGRRIWLSGGVISGRQFRGNRRKAPSPLKLMESTLIFLENQQRLWCNNLTDPSF